MASNLADFSFTNRSDTAISDDGWYVNPEVVVNARAGNDTITGTGIYNLGTINTGTGNDTITGIRTGILTGGTIGIVNYGGTIDTGAGNDTITGNGISHGIYNSGTINTGGGRDTITGNGISNSGTINTGSGRDTVDALQGGFQGEGRIILGAQNDTLKGFGTGTFKGGTGIDKILFGQGTYTITGPSIISDGVTMNVYEFEKIGGASGGLFNFMNGTLTVNSDGVATFAA
jgi:hypothetical protein